LTTTTEYPAPSNNNHRVPEQEIENAVKRAIESDPAYNLPFTTQYPQYQYRAGTTNHEPRDISTLVNTLDELEANEIEEQRKSDKGGTYNPI
jgi:hypothetical protein